MTALKLIKNFVGCCACISDDMEMSCACSYLNVANRRLLFNSFHSRNLEKQVCSGAWHSNHLAVTKHI